MVYRWSRRLDCYRVELDKVQERYPTSADTDYKPVWPNNRPFPNGQTLHYLEHPDDCGTSSWLNKKLPVRLTKPPKPDADDMTDPSFVAFGIHVEQGLNVCVLALFLVLIFIVVFGGTIWLIPWWLNSHPDDLQNATVPIVVVSATVLGITSNFLLILFSRHQLSR